MSDRKGNKKSETRKDRAEALRRRMARVGIFTFVELARRISRRNESIHGYLNEPTRFPVVHNRIDELINQKPKPRHPEGVHV